MGFIDAARYDVACIRFVQKCSDMEPVRISDKRVVDVAPDGKVYGVELLKETEQLYREDGGKLIEIDEATGERVELPLASIG